MKIFVAGSMHFAKEMLEAEKILKSMGHVAILPSDVYECLNDPSLNMNPDHGFKTDIMRSCMDLQEKCDALLVLNYPHHSVDGYIGSHTLMELGLAYYLKQKIFLLFPCPPEKVARYWQEVMHMKPVILNGEFKNIKP